VPEENKVAFGKDNINKAPLRTWGAIIKAGRWPCAGVSLGKKALKESKREQVVGGRHTQSPNNVPSIEAEKF
jgi:hypothetical protein